MGVFHRLRAGSWQLTVSAGGEVWRGSMSVTPTPSSATVAYDLALCIPTDVILHAAGRERLLAFVGELRGGLARMVVAGILPATRPSADGRVSASAGATGIEVGPADLTIRLGATTATDLQRILDAFDGRRPPDDPDTDDPDTPDTEHPRETHLP